MMFDPKESARKFGRLSRLVLLQFLLATVTILGIDVLSFVLLPDGYAAYFPGYRQDSDDIRVVGIGPNGYFRPHPDRGFDIIPNQRGYHYVGNDRYPIWSNELGCFDVARNDPPDEFVYFAGDSFTWGWAPFESKFGTIFERIAGVPILKCGVLHTGQFHQFSKFLEISKKLGRWPKLAVVFYYDNDADNDFVHPHSTVVDGWLVNSRGLDENGHVLEFDREWVEKGLADALEAEKTRGAVRRFLRRYSFTSHIAIKGARVSAALVKRVSSPVRYSFAGDESKFEYKGRVAHNMYVRSDMRWKRHENYDYAYSPHATANKMALRVWAAHAKENGYMLRVFLIARLQNFRTDFYKELRAYLDEIGIPHNDLTEEAAARNIDPATLFLSNDEHFSVNGDGVVGKILVDILCGPVLHCTNGKPPRAKRAH